jgi:hypothetical protein
LCAEIVIDWVCLIRSLPNVRQPALAYLASCLPLSRNARHRIGGARWNVAEASGSDGCSLRPLRPFGAR